MCSFQKERCTKHQAAGLQETSDYQTCADNIKWRHLFIDSCKISWAFYLLLSHFQYYTDHLKEGNRDISHQAWSISMCICLCSQPWGTSALHLLLLPCVGLQQQNSFSACQAHSPVSPPNLFRQLLNQDNCSWSWLFSLWQQHCLL